MTPPYTGQLADPDRLLYPTIRPHHCGSPQAAMTSLRRTHRAPTLGGHAAAANPTATSDRLQYHRGSHSAAMTSLRSARRTPTLGDRMAATDLTTSYSRLQYRGTPVTTT